MKKKISRVPEGYSRMQDRPSDREIHKNHRIQMIWTQNKKPVSKQK